MVDFDELLRKGTGGNTPNPLQPSVATDNYVVIDEGKEMNLRLFGAISNGNAIIPLSHGKGIKFVRGPNFTMKNGKTGYMVTIQILDAGCGKSVKSQSWNRTKTVTKKVEVPRKQQTNKVELKTDNDVQKKSIFDIN